ncbi:MAG TPA: non-homologous end-joining DNA ligase [Chitinophagaceae bacterium]|nr:non-homologous end-joining DNA ligase [Chitinophagaceae bacterium]
MSRNEKIQNDGKVFTFGKIKLKTTHLSKIFFPEDGVTKGDIIDYYISISGYILPYLKDRPESLLRHPNGIHEQGFFQKDAADIIPSFAKSKKIFSESNQKEVDYIVCNNVATLIYLNNLGCIELNPWHSTISNLSKPDYLIIDIDPSSENTFNDVVEVALAVKEILDKAGATSFCKTSGATGMHVYVPVQKKYSYEQVKEFAHLVCVLVVGQMKDSTTLERNLQKRSSKKIYMDYLQNSEGQTIAAAYSLRPKVGATVSTPLQWKEVKKGLSPHQFTIYNVLQRVQKKGDLFEGVLGKGIDLKKCLKNLGA